MFHKRDDWEWLYGHECSLSEDLPNSSAAVCCPLVQTNLVQRQGSVNRLQRAFQFMQVLCLLHVILQRFIETDVLLEHRVRGVVQLPEKFTGQQKYLNTSLCTCNRHALKTQRFLDYFFSRFAVPSHWDEQTGSVYLTFKYELNMFKHEINYWHWDQTGRTTPVSMLTFDELEKPTKHSRGEIYIARPQK